MIVSTERARCGIPRATTKDMWHPDRRQRATIFDICFGDGLELTVVLATRKEALSLGLHVRLDRLKNKAIMHIARADGAKPDQDNDHLGAKMHSIPVFDDESDKRTVGLATFWKACKETAVEGLAVVIHCTNSILRAPLAAAAIMVRAGYHWTVAIEIIAEHRHIYPGLYLPWDEWPRSEKLMWYAPHILECHEWLQFLEEHELWAAATADILEADANADASTANTADASAANTADILVADANAANATDAAVAANAAPAGANDANMGDGGDWYWGRWRWRCSSCNIMEDLLQCSECPRWDCWRCRFSCTTCPSLSRRYSLCGHCNQYRQGMYFARHGRTLRCHWCENYFGAYSAT